MKRLARILLACALAAGATATAAAEDVLKLAVPQRGAWDTSITFDYMPKQYITFRAEYDYRHASVPYWSGAGGITPPGGNNGSPQFFTCSNGTSSGQTSLGPAETACGGGLSSVWFPDLRKNESFIDLAIMVKF